LVSEEDGPFWDFGSFAIGLDVPERIHRFAQRATKRRSLHATVVAPLVSILEELPVCRSAAIAEGTLVRIDHPVAGALAMTRQQGRLYATADSCPHEVASLSSGFVDGGRIVCPLHFAEFDLEDGAPHHAPEGCGRLAVYPVSERAGEIYVSVPAAGKRELGGS
jgi:nitrite reductase/ring-hydroxylating ferredoxin subunit